MVRLALKLFVVATPLLILISSCDKDPCPEVIKTEYEFDIDENSSATTIVGQITPEVSVSSYLISSGNTANAFEIDADGTIKVLTESAINYEENELFELAVQAQTADCGTIDLLVTVALNDLADEIFRDPLFNVAVERSVAYGDLDNQVMNVFYPTDSEVRRPLLVMARGGGFGGGNLDFLNDIGNTLAKAGYVVAAIDWFTDPENKVGSFQRNLFATQDINAAIRFFRKDAAENDIYKVDTDNIFHGGFSSGGNRSFEKAYGDESDFSDLEWSIIQSAGGLEGERGNPGYTSETKAYLNMCGSTQKIDWMQAGELPMVAIHSDNDPEVPYEFANGSFGSKSMTDRAEELGIANRLITINNHQPVNEAHDAPAFCIECYDEVLTFFSQFLE